MVAVDTLRSIGNPAGMGGAGWSGVVVAQAAGKLAMSGGLRQQGVGLGLKDLHGIGTSCEP